MLHVLAAAMLVSCGGSKAADKDSTAVVEFEPPVEVADSSSATDGSDESVAKNKSFVPDTLVWHMYGTKTKLSTVAYNPKGLPAGWTGEGFKYSQYRVTSQRDYKCHTSDEMKSVAYPYNTSVQVALPRDRKLRSSLLQLMANTVLNHKSSPHCYRFEGQFSSARDFAMMMAEYEAFGTAGDMLSPEPKGSEIKNDLETNTKYTIRPEYVNGNRVTMATDVTSTYPAGGGGYSGVSYVTYDVAKGSVLGLDDVFKPGWENDVRKAYIQAGMKKFQGTYGVKEEVLGDQFEELVNPSRFLNFHVEPVALAKDGVLMPVQMELITDDGEDYPVFIKIPRTQIKSHLK